MRGMREKWNPSEKLVKSIKYINNTYKYQSLRKVAQIAFSNCKNENDVAHVVSALYMFHEKTAYRWPLYFRNDGYCNLFENVLSKMWRNSVREVTGKEIDPKFIWEYRFQI